MGYYSSVAYEILKEDEPKLLELGKQNENVQWELDHVDRHECKDQYWDAESQKFIDVDIIIYYWEDTKWYMDGPEAIDKLIQGTFKRYAYCEVGEEIGDVTFKAHGDLCCMCLNIHSYIEIDEEGM